jgi:soluble lytic murein transglycosylase-like protein/predicted Zn-dependent peptidase
MRRLLGRSTVAAAIAVVGLGLIAGSRHAGLRASFSAGYRAFRDPALLDAPPPQAPPPIDCRKLTGDTLGVAATPEQLAVALQKSTPDEDLDDPEGATLASLTLPDIHAPVTRRTMRFVKFLARTDAGRKVFLARFRRAGKYRDQIESSLREAGLPEDLVWLAAVESGFDPRAVSRAGAAGLFQFMPETGQLYGLDQSPWVDERRSVARATAAAVTHLRDLYERFHRWDLALAAYNAGYDRVVNAMDKLARERGPMRLDDKPIEFADLAAARALPEETTSYVPQILAFALVAQNLAHFGLDDAELAASLDPGEIAVPEGTRLRTIARAAGISTVQLREYNPQILRDRVPPTGGDYLITVPADRVAHALATFPSYLDQEVLAQNEPDDEATVLPVVNAVDGVDAVTDEPLPRRPVPLGRNRLPSFALPGEQRELLGSASLDTSAILGAKLPQVLLGVGIGWQKPYDEDPLGLLRGRFSASSAKGRGTALDKQLGFLDEPPSPEALRSFTLPNGIAVRLRRDAGAAFTAITVRIAGDAAAIDERPASGGRRVARAGDGGGATETLHTLTVARGDVEAGIELAAARVRLALGEASTAEVTEIRRQAGEPRRKFLASTPYGPAWIALGNTLFPAGHPLAGTVLGTGADPSGARDLLLAETIAAERTRARASITVVGDVDEVRARKLTEAFLGSVSAPIVDAVPPHPREERLVIEDVVLGPRALYGWIAPAEAETGDASMRVAIEILQNPKIARLAHALIDPGLASLAQAAIDPGQRASVAAIEIAPAGSHDLIEVERRLEAEIAALADTGPTPLELAVAKAYLEARLKKELAPAPPGLAGVVHSATTLRLRRALRPGQAEKILAAVQDVSQSSVRAAVKRVLSIDHRVVITTLPTTKGALSAAEPPGGGRSTTLR